VMVQSLMAEPNGAHTLFWNACSVYLAILQIGVLGLCHSGPVVCNSTCLFE